MMYDHETKQQFHGNETRLIKLVQLSAVMVSTLLWLAVT